MSSRILTGKPAADAILEQLRIDVAECNPHLAIVQVGKDDASDAYIKRKLAACADIGMRCTHHRLPHDITLHDLLKRIEQLNHDNDTTGFIIQTPLPDQLWNHMGEILSAIDPRKDVDGFTAQNVGKALQSIDGEVLPPATPAGVIALFEHYDITIAGMHAVIVGRSNIVGKPLGFLLLNRSATVTLCHSKTVDLASHTRQADLLVSAVGQPKLITADMVKPGAVIIDVGITREEEGLTGDVDFDPVSQVSSAITPVPGGVGPMTVACLLRNCIRAARMHAR